jgi:CBS-domain-containing membrane protein
VVNIPVNNFKETSMTKLALNTFRFPENTCIPQAQPKAASDVTVESSGITVMTDLAVVRAATIMPDTTLDKAEQTMIQQGVRSLFVVSGYPCVGGLVTANDLLGDKPVRLMTHRKVHRDDLTVTDVMTKLSELDALDYNELKDATVGDVIDTFKRVPHTHLLVVQSATTEGPARIRGVISITQIERQLGHSVL